MDINASHGNHLKQTHDSKTGPNLEKNTPSDIPGNLFGLFAFYMVSKIRHNRALDIYWNRVIIAAFQSRTTLPW